jgi:hypothetical protein
MARSHGARGTHPEVERVFQHVVDRGLHLRLRRAVADAACELNGARRVRGDHRTHGLGTQGVEFVVVADPPVLRHRKLGRECPGQLNEEPVDGRDGHPVQRVDEPVERRGVFGRAELADLALGGELTALGLARGTLR